MSIKDFTILAKLGQGAYSSVYKVQRISDQQQYALKKVKLANLSEKQLQNAVNQVRILASIKSSNIIGYKETFLEGKNLCIIMEMAGGGDLYQKIQEYKKNRRHFEQAEIWRVFIQMAKALNTLHEMKIYHRDLKSANVFLMNNGVVKLGDLNVSKIAKNGLLYTQTGTPYYASPQVWKDQPYDDKSDIWSFGCVMYEMATLEPPFKAQDMQGLGKAVTQGIYPPLPNFYSNELLGVVKMMLQQKPKNRPSTKKLLKSALFGKKASQLNLSTLPDEQQMNQELLQTIRIPKNLYYLTDRLPNANYDQHSKKKLHQINKSVDFSSKSREMQRQKHRRQKSISRINKIVQNHEELIRGNEQQPKKSLKSRMLSVQGYSKIMQQARRKSIDRSSHGHQQISRVNQRQKRRNVESYERGFLPPIGNNRRLY